MKKIIIEDWLTAFPHLTKFGQNKLYKVLGPFITGIELIKLPRNEGYRPCFVIYALWGSKAGKDLKSCLSGPLILKEFHDRKSLDYSIAYGDHEKEFPNMLKEVNKQLPYSLSEDVSLKEVINCIDDRVKRESLGSYIHASILEFQLELSFICGSKKVSQKILTQIRKINWKQEQFKLFNIDFEEWFRNQEVKEVNIDILKEQLDINLKDKKLDKLEKSSLLV